jgi:hypothetical protein
MTDPMTVQLSATVLNDISNKAIAIVLLAGLAVSGAFAPVAAWSGQPATLAAKENGPPLVGLPIDSVEPARSLTALAWNSPYCAHWDDGCTECERSFAYTPPKCRESTNAEVSACKRHAIICYKEINRTDLSKICSMIYRGQVISTTDGAILIDFERLDVEWLYVKGLGWVANPNNRLMLGGGSFLVSDIDFVPISGSERASHLPRGRESVLERQPEYKHAVYCAKVYNK